VNNCSTNFDAIDQINRSKKTVLFYKIICGENWSRNYKIIAAQKLAQVKVYSSNSNCHLQVNSRIVKGVHLSLVNWEEKVYWHLKIGIRNPEPQEINIISEGPEKQKNGPTIRHHCATSIPSRGYHTPTMERIRSGGFRIHLHCFRQYFRRNT
jgi:hypothetical protein